MSETIYDVEFVIKTDMVRPAPYVNKRKLKNLPPDAYSYLFHDETIKLTKILEENVSGSNETITAIKNYVVINLVTIIESTLRSLVKVAIDSNDKKIKKILDRDEVIIPLSIFDQVKKSELTKGEIVATHFNLQNPLIINKIFSKILGMNYFETIKEILKESIKVGGLEDWANLDTKPKSVLQGWGKFEKLFEQRNLIVHNIDKEVNFSIDELIKLTSNIFMILEMSTYLMMMWNDSIEDFKEFLESAPELSWHFAINDNERLVKVLRHQVKEYKKNPF